MVFCANPQIKMHSAWQHLSCKDVVRQILSPATSLLQSCRFGQFSVKRRMDTRCSSWRSACNIQMGTQGQPGALSTHDWGMSAPPAKIKPSPGFPFAFLELLFSERQHWTGEEGVRAGSHLGTGQLLPGCLQEKVSLRLMSCNCCSLFPSAKHRISLCCGSPGAALGAECPGAPLAVAVLMIHCPHPLKSKIPAWQMSGRLNRVWLKVHRRK